MLVPGMVFLKHLSLFLSCYLIYIHDQSVGIACFQKHVRVEDANLKRVREDLQNRVDFLRKQADVSPRLLIVLDCCIRSCRNFYSLMSYELCCLYFRAMMTRVLL